MALVPRFRRPWIRTTATLLVCSALYAWLRVLGTGRADLLTVALDLALGVGALVLTFVLCAQVLLPLRAWERVEAPLRLFFALLGRDAPATYVLEGKLVKAGRAGSGTSSGIAIVDRTSALAVGTQSGGLEAIGPGLTLLPRCCRHLEAFDLRHQVRLIRGPKDLSGAHPDRPTTLARTLEGFPVSADLTLLFHLDAGYQPASRGEDPPMGPVVLRPMSILRAARRTGEADNRPPRWDDLPLELACESWRRAVAGRTLQQLLKDDSDGATLKRIASEVLQELSPTSSVAAPAEGTPSEHAKALRARGVRVTAVEISNLRTQRDPAAARASGRPALQSEGGPTPHGEQPRPAPGRALKPSVRARSALLRRLTASSRRHLREEGPPNLRDALRMLVNDALQVYPAAGRGREDTGRVNRLAEIHKVLATLGPDCSGSPERRGAGDNRP